MKKNIKDSFWMFGGIVLLGVAMWLASNAPVEKKLPTENVKSVNEAGIQDEGSFSSATPNQADAPAPALTDEQLTEGSGTKGFDGDHPGFESEEKLVRGVFVPTNVKGKWKSVKILIKNKQNEELNEVKTLDLGSSFTLADGNLKITVGPYFPNFVMDKNLYTSMDNVEWNPAVQLVVEENGKESFRGWSFKKFPEMYAFEHEDYSLELIAAVPMEIS
jgi:hypothetical protein